MIEEEQKTKLIADEPTTNSNSDLGFGGDNDGDAYDEMKPSSSKVKKVILWNENRRRFEIKEED